MQSGVDLFEYSADGFTPIIGFRRFRVPYMLFLKMGQPHVQLSTEDMQLMSVNMGRGKNIPRWKPGNNDARCLDHDHPAPEQGCKCGLHAFMEVKDALNYVSNISVLAAVIGWGRMYFDDLFWRAEKARVIALCAATPYSLKAPSSKPGLAGIYTHHNHGQWISAAETYVTHASAMYNVPVLQMNELKDYVLLYGDEFGGHGDGKAPARKADGAQDSARRATG